ncbi:hypothetical protein F3N42_14320 [Marinihelvus fidelis]|uniref:Uncharacterized protein n=1 Tax=Marinihelvus fidelis TaxID=2613842 RepID=A0A5N0T5U5_9GAMM|nr:hypothetical protein [Marinihelvus fidelis]KAA9129824.1 hypothetical protein F3N42_14320 [Marinihelvus fidelis]
MTAADTDSQDLSTDHEPLDQMQAQLFALMHRYSQAPCCGLALAVAGQLVKLLEHPLITLFPELHRQCAAQLNGWRARGSFAERCGSTPRSIH